MEPLQALLLDLDGTLLKNDMDVFVSAYLEALGRFMSGRVPPDRLVPELLRATQIMAANDGSGASNEEVFASVFYPAVGVDRSQLEPLFMRFYSEEFPGLRRCAQPVQEARNLVEWAFSQGLKVVIATNPLFPRTAIEQRLDWAGVGVESFPYDLVTTYEESHASKQSPAYYREILDRIGCAAETGLMVGDNWDWDVASSTSIGLKAWWIAAEDALQPSEVYGLVGQGPLGDLWKWLVSEKAELRSEA